MTMNAILWPENCVLRFIENFASNEAIVAGIRSTGKRSLPHLLSIATNLQKRKIDGDHRNLKL